MGLKSNLHQMIWLQTPANMSVVHLTFAVRESRPSIKLFDPYARVYHFLTNLTLDAHLYISIPAMPADS